MEVIVREYKEKDLDSVNIILSEAFNIEKENFNYENNKEVVATLNNQVVGYLLLTKIYNPIKNISYFIVDNVCVLSSKRGLGIGKKMLDYVDTIAKEDNISYITLTSNYQRVAAHKLYEKCGYIKRESNIFKKEVK
jgi:ribosomal protein S18 acetylase RimI-like enzyme